MKKYCLLFCFTLLTSISIFAQRINASKVPDRVMSAFYNAQPPARNAKWQRVSSDYRVEFRNVRNENMAFLFAPEGTILETETDIAFSELPKATQLSLKDKKVKDIRKISSRKGKTTYKLSAGRKQLQFSANGKPLISG
jgi:hypothetical protein